jgi:hypothetical protein
MAKHKKIASLCSVLPPHPQASKTNGTDEHQHVQHLHKEHWTGSLQNLSLTTGATVGTASFAGVLPTSTATVPCCPKPAQEDAENTKTCSTSLSCFKVKL